MRSYPLGSWAARRSGGRSFSRDCRAAVLFLVASVLLGPTISTHGATAQETLQVPGLQQSVEIITDRWGIAHIYAETEEDLFFAQGFSAARDRLFQFEVWRRQTNGTVAEILGRRELERDIGTRLFMFRGDMTQEMKHYHPRGDLIIPAFVQGVNAFIDMTEQNPDLLPLEFGLLGIKPGKWTPETVISRHQGLLGNIGQELNFGRAVAAVGEGNVKETTWFHPGDPDISIDPAIDQSLLTDDILGLYNAFRRPIQFRPGDVAAEYRGDSASYERLANALPPYDPVGAWGGEDIGSNNWVVDGSLSQSGYPMMANDPHRVQAVPSLRYWVHLVGPGWNVIGGGEPEIPGVSIGHNEYGAWGLTVFSTDGEDLYVYDTNPANPNEYRYRDRWEPMTIIVDTIAVEGSESVVVDLKYSRHGPIVFEDSRRNKAYAVRAAWMEVGGAPYLASLRMDQARTWEEFREACNFSHIPGENMVWADRDGNIGWQAVGIAPIRRNWSGLVPVPGDGRYEWDGYLPIKAKPHVVNPARGFFGTANSNLTSPDFPYRDAVGWTWSDPFRWARLNEVLGSGRRHSLMDMMLLQTDEYSIPAATLVPLLRGLVAEGDAERARALLLEWDFVLNKESVAAGVYVAWERRIQQNIVPLFVPEAGREYIRSIQMKRILDWIVTPPGQFGEDPTEGRDVFLLRSLREAIERLREKLGPEMQGWRYGQEGYKHAYIPHPLSPAVTAEARARLDVGTRPRGGNGYTVNSTGGGDNQRSGASFRIIVDTEDWDRTVGMNNPGQSGDPDSPHYRDLFDSWASDKFFPVLYSRDKVERVVGSVTRLTPSSD